MLTRVCHQGVEVKNVERLLMKAELRFCRELSFSRLESLEDTSQQSAA